MTLVGAVYPVIVFVVAVEVVLTLPKFVGTSVGSYPASVYRTLSSVTPVLFTKTLIPGLLVLDNDNPWRFYFGH